MMEEIKLIVQIVKDHGFWTGFGVSIIVFLIWVIKSEWVRKMLAKAGDRIVEWFMKTRHP